MLWFKRVCLFISLLLVLPVQAEPAGARGFDQIIKSGKLRVGGALFSPWTMRASNGDLIGSEVDIAQRLAKDMGVELELGIYDFDQLIPALEKGDIDLIVAGLGVTPGRALKINFSLPYASSGIDMAANIGLTKTFKNFDEINQKGIKVGVVSGAVAVDLAQRKFPKATVKTFSDQKKAADALLAGELHVYLESWPIPKYMSLKHPDKVDVPLSRPLLSVREAFAVRKGDADFVNYLNAWIVAREADGWIDSTRYYWFETLKWRGQLEQ